jgi:outer membrane protein OmpA-like peptidoglycan-associated protein
MARAGVTTLILAATALLAGCMGRPRFEVVLLPQDSGKPSAVSVQPQEPVDTSRRLLNQPYQRLRSFGGREPSLQQLTPAEVQQLYGPLFAMRPAAPERFTMYFQIGGAALSAESHQTLLRIKHAAAQRPAAELIITGHTDTLGPSDVNDALSLARAQQVRDMLVALGIAASQIETVGRGERELAIWTDDGIDEPLNRRVEIVLR